MPPPSRSERKAILAPSGENTGSDLSAASRVSRTGAPPATCWTQISKLPSPPRSEAYASNLPSWEIVGSVVRPASAVSRVSTTPRGGASGFNHHESAAPAARASSAATAVNEKELKREGRLRAAERR